MIILIAESKTMSAEQGVITEKEFNENCPIFENETDKIVEFLRGLDAGSLAHLIGVSNALAQKSVRLYYEFPDKKSGYPAIEAFTGEVFRALSYSTLGVTSQAFLRENTLMISSLYGLLRCESIIKPYRLDFKTEAAGGDEPMWKFWKSKVTIALVRHLKQKGCREIVNLLPADASKCIDWKIVKAFARVEKPDFKVVSAGGELNTPPSGKLKEFRGIMLREISEKRIQRIDELITLSCASFTPDIESYREGIPVFIGL